MCEAFEKPYGKAMTTNAYETSSDSASDAANTPKKDDDIPIRSAKAVGRCSAAAAVGGRGGAAAAVCCGCGGRPPLLRRCRVGPTAVVTLTRWCCCGGPRHTERRRHVDRGGAAAVVSAGQVKRMAAVRDEKRPSLPVSRAER